ncbi:ParB/RepB/Spo0J family partition protein [Velocimicrobium porci]|uniref:ParB/RepB/Spo0J family partition protein n=1 Tax=Velocimicrobium porci TaxID=2606634 RepID=A0A6L5XWX9_9FIRM|nr:ParB/RepB/Spo0J family partition protein [Velocimicrobium porci]MSS62951.1 ParB/RepB/Spo0J family partition protein [Velocimicrobium porci]
MVAKRGLGKGLDSMIPEKAHKDEKKDNVSRETLIGINEIEPNKSQPRKNFDEDALQELADSIKQFGIIQPLILQKKQNFYEIIAGERRWRAARLAGLKKVPAIIRDYSEQESVEISIIENIQREDLNPIEEAVAYQRLIQEFKLKQDEVAERVSKSRTAITNSMRLLKLDKRVQQMLIDDIISSGHGRALLAIENKNMQYTLAMKILDEKLSVRETEKLVKKLLKDNQDKKELIQKTDNKKQLLYQDLEEKIRSIVGTKVNINQKKNSNRGKIEIEYYSEEELERIIDMLMTVER